MENLKVIVFSVAILVLLALAGYWGFSTIETGREHVDKQAFKDLIDENEDLQKEILDLNNEVAVLQEQLDKQNEILKEEEESKEELETTKPAEQTTYKYQTLVNAVQKLISDVVYMKKGSKGTRVGTVQEFLNLYNKTSNKVDNDYGPGIVTAVKNFQKDQGLTADGQAGPGTFRKMLDWLKKQ